MDKFKKLFEIQKLSNTGTWIKTNLKNEGIKHLFKFVYDIVNQSDIDNCYLGVAELFKNEQFPHNDICMVIYDPFHNHETEIIYESYDSINCHFAIWSTNNGLNPNVPELEKET